MSPHGGISVRNTQKALAWNHHFYTIGEDVWTIPDLDFKMKMVGMLHNIEIKIFGSLISKIAVYYCDHVRISARKTEISLLKSIGGAYGDACMPEWLVRHRTPGSENHPVGYRICDQMDTLRLVRAPILLLRFGFALSSQGHHGTHY